MDNNKNTNILGSIVAIAIFIIVALIGVIVYMVYIDKDNSYMNKNLDNKKETKVIENKTKTNSFTEAIAQLDYSKINNSINDSYIQIDENKNNNSPIISIKTKKVLFKDSTDMEWFGKFGIVSTEDYEYIIDDKDNIIYKTEDWIVFYPETKVWVTDDSNEVRVYNYNGDLFDTETTNVSGGKYFYDYYDNTWTIKTKDNEVLYTSELENDNTIYNFTLETDLESYRPDYTYGLIYLETEEKDLYGIINLDTKKIVYDLTEDEITMHYNNLFELNKKTIVLYKDEIIFEGSRRAYDGFGISDKYVSFDNRIYNLETKEEIFDDPDIPAEEDIIIAKENNMEITTCKNGFGLKYKGDEVLPCKYEELTFFLDSVNKSLIKSNKYYVLLDRNGTYEIYDIINKKTVKLLADQFDYGIVVSIYENDDVYFYNVLTDKQINNKKGEVLLYSSESYYVLTDEDESYYDYYSPDFKLIYSTK